MRMKKFIVAKNTKDREALKNHGFREISKYHNGQDEHYVFVNSPALFSIFKMADMSLIFTDRLMF